MKQLKKYSTHILLSLLSLIAFVVFFRFVGMASAPLSILLLFTFWFTSVFVIFNFVTISSNEGSLIKISFLLLFFAAICTPSIVTFILREKQDNKLENRTLAALPELTLNRDFARAFESYFNDNFGFRSTLISTGSYLKKEVFGVPMDPTRAMIGKEGFIFYNNANGADYIFRSYTHGNLLNDDDLQTYATRTEDLTKKNDSAGILYITGFWPNPQTIYPELMPKAMRFQIRDTLSKADQIIRYFKQRKSAVNFIDVREALLKAKKENLLYKKLDTHWNDLGAYVAYYTMFNALYDKLGIKPRELDEFDVTWKETRYGDLVAVMGLESTPDPTLEPILTPKDSFPTFKFVDITGYPADTKITKCPDCADNRRVLVFYDSYTESLENLYSRHFKEVFYMKWAYQQATVDLIKPSIVIYIPVERYL